jgi:hypothetical protein
MRTTLNPEIAALLHKIEEHSKELAEMRGNVRQLDWSRPRRTTLRTRHKIIGATARQSIRQLIALIVTLLAIAGGLAYQTSSLEKRFAQMERSSNTRFEMLEKRIDQLDKDISVRMQNLEKNITARFENLKHEVRARGN